ncbi:MAG: SMP-30/gluconolactonase/LRE family protein [Candidatus Sphingomonas phytovorans]|nr:SMP-30/gluconolactonase/LRE family protein [Sphingomonas sp.]WEJ98819.1 MAG: SMP-30/gluconolactonase/LRE family protein [Sphingomonas sp.]
MKSVLKYALVMSAGIAAVSAATAQTSPAAPAVSEVVRVDPALDTLIAPGALVEKVATGFKFVEGPMWREGRLWFSDVGGEEIRAVTPDGKVELLVDHAGGYPNPKPGKTLGPNAMATDKDGTVVYAQQGGRNLSRLDAKLAIKPFLSTYQGKKINSPNDLVFAKDGALWFTDPPFGPMNMEPSPPLDQPFAAVYRYAGGKLTPMVTDLALPNGLAFSNDGRTFYVNSYGPEMFTRAYDMGKDGTLSNPRVLFTYDRGMGRGGPDGLKTDIAGNVWSTGPGGIRVITPQGRLLGQITLPEVAANLAWGGADGKDLYITGSTSIYRLRTKVAGTPPLYRR